MNILLIRHHDKGNINTRLPESLNKVQGIYPPLGISYIASMLEYNGYKVSILDSIALNLTAEETKEWIQKENPDIVGITTMTSTVKGALEVAEQAKETGATVVLGGPQLAIYPKETLSYDFIDYGIVGEGEYTMLELVQNIEKDKGIENIRGLAYKENGNVKVNGSRIVENLDELPFPAWHLIPMNKYYSVIALHPFVTMMTTRGCPYKCAFCFKLPADKKFRYRSGSNVVDEMEKCIKKYKIKEIMFYDDTLTLKRDHIVDMCNEILARGLDIKWESPTRIDCVDKDLLKLMSKAGCIRLRYGVESGNSEILKLMNKRITKNRARKVFQWSKEAGIETFAYFMIGYIHETPETMRETISFAKELDPDWVMFTATTPYPNTQLYELAIEEGLIEYDYWSDFTLGLVEDRLLYLVDDVEEWIKRAYREFYFRPRFILKKLLKMRSIDTLKKNIAGIRGLVLFNMK